MHDVKHHVLRAYEHLRLPNRQSRQGNRSSQVSRKVWPAFISTSRVHKVALGLAEAVQHKIISAYSCSTKTAISCIEPVANI